MAIKKQCKHKVSRGPLFLLKLNNLNRCFALGEDFCLLYQGEGSFIGLIISTPITVCKQAPSDSGEFIYCSKTKVFPVI